MNNETKEIYQLQNGGYIPKNAISEKRSLPNLQDNIIKWCYDSLMSEPHYWIRQGHILIHKIYGVAIWIANGIFHLEIYKPDHIEIPFIWKFKIWKAYKTRWQRIIAKDYFDISEKNDLSEQRIIKD